MESLFDADFHMTYIAAYLAGVPLMFMLLYHPRLRLKALIGALAWPLLVVGLFLRVVWTGGRF